MLLANLQAGFQAHFPIRRELDVAQVVRLVLRQNDLSAHARGVNWRPKDEQNLALLAAERAVGYCAAGQPTRAELLTATSSIHAL
jgi:hypothetical protein